MARRAPLAVWWGEVHVADLEPKKPWDLRCRYTVEAQERWDIGVPLLSCALPVGSLPLRATNFVRGVLPEGRHLQSVADRAKVTTNDHYGLLARYGRDIAGAIIVAASGESPDSGLGSVEPYSGADLEEEIAALGDNSLGLHPDSELSIAGLQNKLLLVETEQGGWGRPVHGYPSTHILKIDDDRHPGLVRAEAACLALAHAVGVANAPPRFENLAGVDCIIVTRHDRAVIDGRVVRRHQEDACQALDVDIDAHRGRGKYERYGGPTLAQIAELLRVHARDAEAELEQLVRMITFTVAIGNADLHGKNISLLHDDEGRISLAPAYDTVPTMMWPTLRASSAVSVGGSSDFAAIDIGRIATEAGRWGMDGERAREVAVDTSQAIRDALGATVGIPALAEAISMRAAPLLG